jgi:hypothetical protein
MVSLDNSAAVSKGPNKRKHADCKVQGMSEVHDDDSVSKTLEK